MIDIYQRIMHPQALPQPVTLETVAGYVNCPLAKRQRSTVFCDGTEGRQKCPYFRGLLEKEKEIIDIRCANVNAVGKEKFDPIQPRVSYPSFYRKIEAVGGTGD